MTGGKFQRFQWYFKFTVVIYSRFTSKTCCICLPFNHHSGGNSRIYRIMDIHRDSQASKGVPYYVHSLGMATY
jgi:hypothetical protein